MACSDFCYSREACPLAVLENYGSASSNFRLILLLMTCGVENLARCCNAYVGISHPMESTIAALLGSGPHAMTPLVL